jgi:hypothetical protein
MQAAFLLLALVTAGTQATETLLKGLLYWAR